MASDHLALDGSLREEYAWIVPEVLREFLYHEKMLLLQSNHTNHALSAK